ncbi:MAG: tetratricopeptide repeat protein [Lachnospiraceae bacterium]|nr:tetratricopeptide repeat protein [Lachnospiraceae bacterium]
MKKYKEALEEYQTAAEDYQDEPELYYNRGCAYEGLGDTENATADFKKTLELNDHYRNTNVKLFNIYRKKYGERNRKEDFEQALSYINKQIEIRETSTEYFRRALLYYDITDMQSSLADYEKSLELDPDDYVTYSNMGFCYRVDRQFEKAIEYFQKARELMEEKNDNTRPYFQSGMCYKSMGRYDEALKCFLEGAEIFPGEKDDPFWQQVGYVYESMGEYDKAREAFENLKGISDDYYSDMAGAWIEEGNPKKGLKILKNRIKTAPQDKKAAHYDELGDCYYDLLEYAKAAECYQKAVSLEKDPEKLYDYESSLAKTYYLMGKQEKAKEHAQKAFDYFHEIGWVEEDYVNYKANAPVRLGCIGWLYLCLGDKEKAEENFKRMDEIHLCRYCTHEKCFESSLWLGRFYESLGDYERAVEYLEETLRRDPERVQAKKALENLRRKL